MANYNNNYNVAKTANEIAAKQPFSTFMKTVGNKLVANTINDEKRRNQFIANIVSAVSTNPTLQECDKTSIVAAALQAEALHFPINNSLGYVYLVPFNDKKKGKVAQFMISYKGYIQLAIRSGYYKALEVTDVREGELAAYNPLKGQTFNWCNNYEERLSKRVIGYVARLELVNGFAKEIYWTYEAMLDHADKYSQAFSKNAVFNDNPNKCKVSYEDYLAGKYNSDDEWKYSSYWYKDFQEMAYKTMLRQLLSKWGIMSVEMQEAYVNDQAAFDEAGNRDYIDSNVAYNKTQEEQKEMGKTEIPQAPTPQPTPQPTTADDVDIEWMNE